MGGDFACRKFPDGDEREYIPSSTICECPDSGVHG